MFRKRLTKSEQCGFLVLLLTSLTNIPGRVFAGAPAYSDSASQKGAWGPLINTYEAPIHAALLPNGKVLLLGLHGVTWSNIYQWFSTDSSTVITRRIGNPENLICSGHTGLSDGRLLTNGGSASDAHTYTYDHTASSYSSGDTVYVSAWSERSNSNHQLGRYYPTCTVLATGKVLVVGDATDGLTDAKLTPELYDPATNLDFHGSESR